MWVIQHKGMSVTQTVSNSEQGAWNLLFNMFPQLQKKSRRELETIYEYKARKTRTKQEKTE